MRYTFFTIFLFFTNFLNGQLQDTTQRKEFQKWGVKKIEKFIFIDSGNITAEFLFTAEIVNKMGFITKMLNYADDGRLAVYEHFYLNDSILMESHLTQNSNHITQKDWIKYKYNKKNQLEKFSYYIGDRLTTVIKYNYSKNGKLKSQNQKFFAAKSKGSYGGKTKKLFYYNVGGQLISFHEKSHKNGKKVSKNYKYIYHTDPKIVEEYLESYDGEKILERHIFDEDNKLKLTEHYYYHKGSTLYYPNQKINLKKGEALRKEYFYDERGLIILEVMFAPPDQKIKIRYNYFY